LFAPGDFFVDASGHFGPRVYYKTLVAALAHVLGFPLTAFLLNWLSNLVVAIVTYVAGIRLFRSGALTALVAVALAMAIYTIEPGRGTRLPSNLLQPANLALGWALAALLLGLLGRPFWALVLGGATAVLHPLIGVEIAMLAGVAATAGLLLNRTEPHGRIKTLAALIAGSVVCTGIVGAFWLADYGSTRAIDAGDFIRIYAEFRAPHHFIPSTWSLTTHVFTGLFVLATFGAWWTWFRETACDRDVAARMLAVLIVTLGLFAGGYVFVEIWPSRIWTNLNTWRLFFVIRWLGFLLFAHAACRMLTRNDQSLGQWLIALALIGGSGKGHALFPCIGIGFRAIYRRLRLERHPLFAFAGIVAGLVLILLTLRFGNFGEVLQLVLYFSAALWLVSVSNRWVRDAPITLVLICLSSISLVHMYAPNRASEALFDRLGVNFSLEQYNDPITFAAAFAREKTDANAMFVVPPRNGDFRLLARRSLVVDFTSFPFQDWGMAEWEQRMHYVYGHTDRNGHAALAHLENEYRAIDDSRLVAIGNRYGATHAVLYTDTETDLPVIYEDEQYRIVVIPRSNNEPEDVTNE